MLARQSFHPQLIYGRLREQAYLLSRSELFLLLVAACVLLFIVGVWLRSACAGPPPLESASITVQPGDTLWSLAEEYGDPDEYILERVDVLARANGLRRGQVLREGQTLVVPVGNRSAKEYYGGRYASTEIAD